MERVQYSLERSLPQLQLLDREGLLSKEELRSVTSQRSGFEARLVRRRAEKQDFLLYLDFEENLNKLVVLRARQRERDAHAYAKEHGDRSKLLPRHFFSRQAASYSATCISIYERLVRKLRWDVDSWERYLNWAKTHKMRVVTGRVYARAVALHPKVVSLWLQGADYELNDNADTTTARSLLQRALRMNTLDSDAVDARESKLQKTSSGAARATGSISWAPTDYERDVLRLWVEYFRMELVFIERLRRRWKVLGLEAGGGGLATSVSGGLAAAKRTAESVAVETAPVDEESAEVERQVQDDVPEAEEDEVEEGDMTMGTAPSAGQSIPSGHQQIMQGAIPLVVLGSIQKSVPTALQALVYVALLQLIRAFPFFDSTALLQTGQVVCLDTSEARNGDALRSRLAGAILEALSAAAGNWGAEGRMVADIIACLQPVLTPSGAASESSAADELEKNVLLHNSSRIHTVSEPIDSLYEYADVPSGLRELLDGKDAWASSRGLLFIASLLSEYLVQRHVTQAGADDEDEEDETEATVAVEWKPTPLQILYTRTGSFPALMEQLVASIRARISEEPDELFAVAAVSVLRTLANTTRSGIEEPNLVRYLKHVESRIRREFEPGREWLALVGLVPQWSDVEQGRNVPEFAARVGDLLPSRSPGAMVLYERVSALAREQHIDSAEPLLAANWSAAEDGAAAWKGLLASTTVDAFMSVDHAAWPTLLLWLESETVAATGSEIVQPCSARIALWSDYLGWVQQTAENAPQGKPAAQWAWGLYEAAVKRTGALLASSQLVGGARIDAQQLHDSVVRRMYMFAPAAAAAHPAPTPGEAAREAALRALLANSTASTFCWLELARMERVYADIVEDSNRALRRIERLYEHAVVQSERDADVVATWLEYLAYLVSINVPEAMKQLVRATEHVRRVGGAAAADALEQGWKRIMT